MTSFDGEKISQIHRELHSHLPSDPALRVKAIESLLVEKGLLNSDTIDTWISIYADTIGPKRSAQVVARAWLDDDYKARLLEDATAAIGELGFAGDATGHLKAVENTDRVHQPGRLHALLLLSLLDTRHVPGLVQGE